MIVTQLYKGQGLGNQLACYITTRVIAKDKGYDFGIQSPENFKGTDFLNLDFGCKVIGGSGPEGGPPKTLPEGIKYYYAERKITHPISDADIRLYDKNLINILDYTKIDGIMQDEQYIVHRKDEIRKWLKVKEEYECFDYSNNDTCVINFRGGEYARHKDFFLNKKYWEDAISHMLKINKNFKFVVITDDVLTAKKFFPDFGVFHFSIAKDYVIIKNAKYLILSNSSFAWFPAWLSENLKFCIAPKYWGRHNISDGYWSCGYNITKEWMYLDREGNLSDYNACIKEFNEYIKSHPDYFSPIKIKSNFLVVSNHNNDLRWVPEYTDNYLIYDRSDNITIPKTIDEKKIIKSPNIGYNLYDYFTFIVDNYDNLPDTVIFVKGNVFPRHITKEYFERIINNNFFTPIEDHKMHKTYWPTCFFAADGGFCEINNSWYLKHHPTKYFRNYNDFLKFCFKDPVIPKYTRFAPGANYIVPKGNIIKLPKVFYENLRLFISHCPLPGEAHIIERALHTLWTSNFELSNNILTPLNEDFSLPPKNIKILLKEKFPTPIKNITKSVINEAKNIINFIRQPIDLLIEKRREKTWLSKIDIEKYRKKIKIYDIFTFFNELDLLEIRLNILNPYVDYFVIIEATETFSGLPKELIYEKNKERFKKWQHKIIYHVTNDTPTDEIDLRNRLKDSKLSSLDEQIINNALTSDNVPKGQIHWLKEFYQKESIKKALLNLSDNDFCFISDVDEIWNPEIIIDYSKNDIYKLKQDPYVYFLNNRSNEDWAGWTGTIATKYKNIKNNCLNHLRTDNKTKYTVIRNGGWHFTFQGGATQIKKKIESYGHQELNTEEIKINLENYIQKNKDIRGRYLRFWKDETKLPRYLLKNKDKYKNLFR